ncbi:MAG TPA: DUF4157 domain-containing protein [Clostridia bacterium]
MYESKSSKSSDGVRQKAAVNKSLQRKLNFVKPIQRALASKNTLLTGDAVQLRKIGESNSLGSSLNTKPVQREEIPEEEDETLQGKFETIQREDIPEEEEELPVQGKFEPVQMKKENNTGMPDGLKAGVESLSGIDMSDVRVHYNSDRPAGVGALAYTQGTDIHVASGQERHLAHEAWHVVQQAQGRVQPTMQMQGMDVNDDPGLEHEADVMGERALRGK